jgi:hypothetical protein
MAAQKRKRLFCCGCERTGYDNGDAPFFLEIGALTQHHGLEVFREVELHA